MKFLIAHFALLVSVNALTSTYVGDVIGASGIVRQDGRSVQFTREQADNIVLAGPSGILTRDGKNIQLTRNPNRSKRSAGHVTPKGNIGHSGILRADGSTDLFSHDEAHNILLIGPAGIVTKDGKNMQLTDDLRIVGRSKRSAGFVTPKGNLGHSGILRADGSTDLFSHDEAHNILLIGPSGIVTKDGRNMQLTDDLRIVGRSKRSAGFVTPKGNLGYSGILRADGSTDLFSHDEAHNILLIGPSGIVTKDGRNMQLTDDLRIVGRSKRSAGFVTPKGNLGYSGILRADGSTDLFSHDEAHNILLIGPSGIVTKDGRNMQLTDDLRIVGRSKRSAGFVTPKGNLGYSGILRADGSTDLFSHDEAHNILLIGPSGIVTKDGRNMQLTDDLRIVGRSKRSAGFVTPKGNLGYSGILRADGSTDLFSHDEAHNILLIGPSGIVTKDGRNMQLTDDLRIVGRSKRSAGFVTPKGNLGYSGILRADGSTDLFSHDEAHNILLIGPSGIVTKDGRNMQLTDDLRIVGRSKRSAGFVTPKGNLGYSGILRADGSTDLFSHDEAHNILLIGPSGIVTKDGRNMQLTDDLRIVGRSKRSAGFVTPKGNIGHSGILRADGTSDVFSHDEAHNILLIGPSGIVTKDGRNMQLSEDLRIVNRRS
ncbi:uncharacterized protein [Palaemon carinicauda]|uniref:uncharacterized protein n=1 Tax=Palaemon carinicauda TaxID=392227 RepID=UPI0035B5D71B